MTKKKKKKMMKMKKSKKKKKIFVPKTKSKRQAFRRGKGGL